MTMNLARYRYSPIEYICIIPYKNGFQSNQFHPAETMQTWKGTAERIFYANTATPSYSIQMIPAQQQEHQQTTKLLPPPTKRQDEAHVSTSGSKEPVTGTSTGSYEIFGRIEEMLKQVLDETKQIPGITTRAGHQCSEQEEELDENMKNSVVQQTTALIDSLEQLRKFQDIVCRVSLPEETTLKLQDRADAGDTAALVHGNHTKEVVAAPEPGGRRKRKKEEQDQQNKHEGKKRITKSRTQTSRISQRETKEHNKVQKEQNKEHVSTNTASAEGQQEQGRKVAAEAENQDEKQVNEKSDSKAMLSNLNLKHLPSILSGTRQQNATET